VSNHQRAFVTVDRGTATTAVALVGPVAGRLRLLGATAGPAGIPEEALLERVRRRLAGADPALTTSLGLDAEGAAAGLRRLLATSAPAPVLAVIAATERVVRPLAAVAETAGWQVRTLVIAGAEILAVATALADRRVDAILAGASDPPGADERPLIGDLGTLVASATERRPDLVTVLAGGLATPGGRIEAMFRPDRPGPTVLAPSPAVGNGLPLRSLLDGLRGGDADGRRALSAATATLATVLRRRVEVVEIGQSGGARVAAGWQPGEAADVSWASVAGAALLPRAFTDVNLDAVIGWLSLPLDRLRVRDRLRELAVNPWADAAGDGAVLRLAAARAALRRLLDLTPAMDELPAPDLLVAAGGAWQVAPGPAVALALADVVRRPGIRALGLDGARLLAPLGTIEDAAEREAIMADLRDDLLVPLGSLVLPAGMRPGRSAGTLRVTGAGGATDMDLVPGGIELVDLAPGERATLDLRFRDPTDVGVRARSIAAEVVGGLGGLLVDLRDVPLHLPDRLEPRRELLAAWQGSTWPGADR